MDIVDININIHKYMLTSKHRHILHVTNISHWLCVNKNIINNANKQIINNYKKFLNQRNIIIVTRCVKYKIHIVPILCCNVENINNLIVEMIKYRNINMLKLIGNYFNNKNTIKYVKMACRYGHINIVKYLHQEIEWSKENFQSDEYLCLIACENGHLDVVKYLHLKIRLPKKNFQSRNNYACRWACEKGHLNVVKYLHQKIKLTKQDFQSDDNFACQCARKNGHLDVVRYLREEIKIFQKKLT